MVTTLADFDEILNTLDMNFQGFIYPRHEDFIPLNISTEKPKEIENGCETNTTIDDRIESFIEIIQRIRNLPFEEEDEEDFTYKTDNEVFDFVDSVVRFGYVLSSGEIPRPLIAVDGNGGLKLDWRTPDKEVRLSIPANDVPYLYFRNGKDGIIESVDEQTLAKWLSWLNI